MERVGSENTVRELQHYNTRIAELAESVVSLKQDLFSRVNASRHTHLKGSLETNAAQVDSTILHRFGEGLEEIRFLK